MTVLTESPHAGGFILSLANGHRSLKNVVILEGEVLQAGAVLGAIDASGKHVAYDNGGTAGNEAVSGILLHDVDATDGDVAAAIVCRDAEVNIHELQWDDDQDTAAIAAGVADLLTLGIIAR
jgi:hypothetical protein